jgi:hypothetical protein
MHALTMLHNILTGSCSEIHAKRISSLLATVEAVVSGNRLTLSDLGRGLRGPVAVKHNIKRVDRLLGNRALHTETPRLYEALARQCLAGVRIPLIIIDWSDLTPDRHWQLLRASIALEDRSITLYEQVHPQSCATAPHVHKAFLTRLAALLPPGCIPILITDAGFRGPGSSWSIEWAGIGSAASVIVTWFGQWTTVHGRAASRCMSRLQQVRSHWANSNMCAPIPYPAVWCWSSATAKGATRKAAWAKWRARVTA